MTVQTVLLILAIICFVLAAAGVTIASISATALVAVGLALFAAAHIAF